MSNRKQKTAIALTGAVALASGAYALGTQVGDGAASAAGQSRSPEPEALIDGRIGHAFRTHGRGGPPGLDRLADRLGVDESDLEKALEDARSELPEPPHVRDDFAEQLARELGIDRDRVEQALERVHDRAGRELEQRHEDLVDRVADRLNLDADEVREALGDFPFFGHVRPAPPPRP